VKESYRFILASVIAGFVVGVVSFGLVFLSTWIVEAHLAIPRPSGSDVSFALRIYPELAATLGLGWAILLGIVLPIGRRVMRLALSPWPTLAHVALAALAAQAITIFAVDVVVTAFNLRPWINDNVDDYLEMGAEIALYVLPALAAALVVFVRRSRIAARS